MKTFPNIWDTKAVRFYLMLAEGARLRALHSPSWNKWNNPAAILCCTCCVCAVLGFLRGCQSTRMLQLSHSWPLEGGCAPQGLWMALESCGHQGELGWWQPDFSCKVCLRIAWFLLKPFTVQVISTAIHLSGFWCYCKKICCVVHSCGAFHPKSPYSELPARENDTNLHIWLILKVMWGVVVGALLQLCPLKRGEESPPWDNLCFMQQHSLLRTVLAGTTQLLLLHFLGSALFLVLTPLYEAVGVTQINVQLTKLVWLFLLFFTLFL